MPPLDRAADARGLLCRPEAGACDLDHRIEELARSAGLWGTSGEAGLILRAAQEANKAMRRAVRRMELIDKAAKAAETKRRADQARVALTLDQIKRLDDQDWTTQLLAAGNAQKGRTQKRR